jgi:hypothetical protein
MTVVEAVAFDVILVVIAAGRAGDPLLLGNVTLPMVAVMQAMRVHIRVFVFRFGYAFLFRHSISSRLVSFLI